MFLFALVEKYLGHKHTKEGSGKPPWLNLTHAQVVLLLLLILLLLSTFVLLFMLLSWLHLFFFFYF